METQTKESVKKNQNWTLDKAHAKIGFSITHMMVSDIEGSFKSFDVKLNANGDDFTGAGIQLTAEVNSLDTQNESRDAHLKKEDFFNQSTHPELLFNSTSLKKIDEAQYELKGNLSFAGTTKPVVLDVKARLGKNPMSGKIIAGFKATGTIKRSDFGFAPKVPNLIVGDEVQVNANVEFIKE